jgi:hypothetical protein
MYRFFLLDLLFYALSVPISRHARQRGGGSAAQLALRWQAGQLFVTDT